MVPGTLTVHAPEGSRGIPIVTTADVKLLLTPLELDWLQRAPVLNPWTDHQHGFQVG